MLLIIKSILKGIFTTQKYSNDVDRFFTTHIIRALYMSGSNALSPHAYYYICAYRDRLEIIEIQKTTEKIILPYSEIDVFKLIKQHQEEERKSTDYEYLKIKCKNGNYTCDMTFQVNPLKKYSSYNKIAIHYSENIYEYVSKRIEVYSEIHIS